MTAGGRDDGEPGDHGGEPRPGTPARGGAVAPPGTPEPAWHDDPLQFPASSAGWDDDHPAPDRRDGPGLAATPGPGAMPPSAAAAPPPTTAAGPPATGAPPSPGSTSAPEPEASTTVVISAEPEVSAPPIATPPAPAAPPRLDRVAFPAYVPPASAPTPAPRGAPPASAPSSSAASSPGATGAPVAATTPPAQPGEPPLLPARAGENELRSAVGVSPLGEDAAAARRKRAPPAPDRRSPIGGGDGPDDDEPRRPGQRRTLLVAAFSIVAGLAIAAVVVLGRVNSERYLLTCEAERAVPEQGRSFPPWGTRALDGEPWKPLKIAPETRCQPHETDDPLALERLYLAMILDQATGLLTAREVTRPDDAEALLKQALLLTRPPEHEPETLAGERNQRHQEIEHLLGDVSYWRATAKLRDAGAALGEAAKQFDRAAAQHPRHVSDAPAWASYARKLGQELHAGPTGAGPSATPVAPLAPSAASPAAEHPNVPAGVALPVEPDRGSAREPAPAEPPLLDAGTPTGGVLL